MTPPDVGTRAPFFELRGVDGRKHSPLSPAGDPALIGFTKNSCPTCRMTFPFLQRLFERLEDAPIRFLGISQDGEEETSIWGEALGITFPLIPEGPDYPASNAFGLAAVPTIFLVEPDGVISRVLVGFSKGDLEAIASELGRRFRIPGVAPLFVPSDEVPDLKPG